MVVTTALLNPTIWAWLRRDILHVFSDSERRTFQNEELFHMCFSFHLLRNSTFKLLLFLRNIFIMIIVFWIFPPNYKSSSQKSYSQNGHKLKFTQKYINIYFYTTCWGQKPLKIDMIHQYNRSKNVSPQYHKHYIGYKYPYKHNEKLFNSLHNSIV